MRLLFLCLESCKIHGDCAGELEKTSIEHLLEGASLTRGTDAIVASGGCRPYMTENADHVVKCGVFELSYEEEKYKGLEFASFHDVTLVDPACSSQMHFIAPIGCKFALLTRGADYQIVCTDYPLSMIDGGRGLGNWPVFSFRRRGG